jgi:hypothetical protein
MTKQYVQACSAYLDRCTTLSLRGRGEVWRSEHAERNRNTGIKTKIKEKRIFQERLVIIGIIKSLQKTKDYANFIYDNYTVKTVLCKEYK